MNKAEIEQVTELLAQFEPGFLPYPIFEQVARIVALPILEFIPLRMHEGRVEVFLISRGANDPLWPDALHTPGTVIRATDLYDKHVVWPARQRIVEDELENVEITTPHYVGSLLHKSKRGVEQAQLYWIELKQLPRNGSFYDVDNLPPETMDSQKKFIFAAVNNYKVHKNL